ncbi:aminoglycoside phosphotransferase family protein [Chachezhania sediminis]|uniref:aminoglycoside phosphotransferase family protein n=1 Tax=Chachezhania sediminis TaxID=2599291 RepID=UPI001E31A60D|nr:aminoglycoside phosphotransferase family protein [Chachezhania sediminis]
MLHHSSLVAGRPGPNDQPPKALLAAVGDAGLKIAAEACAWLPGGRTNRLWLCEGPTGRVVLKLYAAPDGNPLFDNDPMRERAALQLFAAEGLAPALRVAGSSAVGDWSVYDHVRGGIWQQDAAPVARALARVHRMAPAPASAFPIRASGSAALMAQTLAMMKGSGDKSGDMRRLLTAIRRTPVQPVVRGALLHGDPVPGNIIAEGPTFIDWQCPVLGDPAEDLGLFLSPAMQLLYRGRPLDDGEIAAFLDAYPDRDTVQRTMALAPWFHARTAAYCLWQVARGQTDYAAGLKLELVALTASLTDQRSARA